MLALGICRPVLAGEPQAAIPGISASDGQEGQSGSPDWVIDIVGSRVANPSEPEKPLSTARMILHGTIPEAFSILDTANNSVGYTDNIVFGTAVGSGTVSELTRQIRIRGNAAYKLSAQVTAHTNIAAGASSVEGTTARVVNLGDIGWGISNLDQSGNSVVHGGASPTRSDSIAPGFAWSKPTATGGRIAWTTKTLNDILSGPVQILSGERISASGDNSSGNNFLLVDLKAGYAPEYFTPGDFTVVVTLTIASTGGN